jgi:ribose/xylose/arabinose/galactoside ABC-type transport system permease subunit
MGKTTINRIRRHFRFWDIREWWTIIAFFTLFAAVCLVFQFFNHTFLLPNSIVTMLKTGAINAVAALGLTYVVIVSHSDMAFYQTSCFSAMTMAFCISLGANPFLAVLAGVAAGVIWGLVPGLAIGKWKLPDMISTIAIGSIGFGAGYIFSDGAIIYTNFHTSGIINLSEYRFLGIPISVWVMLALYVLSWFVLDRSRIGRAYYATGSNKKAAFFSGVNVNRTVIAAFMVSGGMAALAAIIYSAAQGQGLVKIGLNFLMPCFSAIYIGWSVFRRPCVIGTFFGVLLSTVITTGFTIMSIPFWWSDMTLAFVLLLAIGLSKIEIKTMEGKK